jgi:hypothetical protein
MKNACLSLLLIGALVRSGYVEAETVHFHVGGPISSASPSVNAEAGTDNTPHKITYEHPSFITVQGWPVSLPYDNPECGNVIVDALRKNSETYVANKDCRAAMRKAFEIQRTTPPPDPKEIRQQATGKVISGGPEVTNGHAAPQAGEPAQGESSEPGERMPPFLERAPN